MKRYWVFEDDACEDKQTLLNNDVPTEHIEVYVKHADVVAVVKPLLDWIVIDEFVSDEMKKEAQRLLKELEGA